ncbi:probable RNA-binding protein 18 isoform X2 [Montipora capricornis]|uniref:probable RNA-binding protein 18 isoform X2 n=1 Tax=Montipora capricornis TaxID=246305 RepID=UPI0035F1228E
MATSRCNQNKDENPENKVWIGNIDKRLSEYNLVKILQRFGDLKKFELLFHKSGVKEGEPRGYCFVEYKTHEGIKDVSPSTVSTKISLNSCESKIKAIETKLKLMESGHDSQITAGGKHPLLVQSEKARLHPYKKQRTCNRGNGKWNR